MNDPNHYGKGWHCIDMDQDSLFRSSYTWVLVGMVGIPRFVQGELEVLYHRVLFFHTDKGEAAAPPARKRALSVLVLKTKCSLYLSLSVCLYVSTRSRHDAHSERVCLFILVPRLVPGTALSMTHGPVFEQ